MRKSAVALLVALVTLVGAFAGPTPARAATGPKVVIIVGATHGATDQYRSYANAEYTEARKYTDNVVRVYSPNATWASVKAAVTGAAIVIYHGHGNGWPSPYTYDPNYTTKDGFGLNASAGHGDNNNRYYGEPYIDDLRFAPHAVVLLHNLCYASGNSEPGNPEPSLAVAKQRADNYASAFLEAGADGVIAGGHESAIYYIRALFTTRQTLDELWQAAPTFNDNVLSFASVRRPGNTVRMDPDQPSRGFYRAITGDLETTTMQITGATYAATDVDPTTLVVPGAASVGVAGVELYADAALTNPVATLDPDTALRVTERVGTTSTYGVETLDGSQAGYVPGTALVPRDSRGPNLWDVEDGTGAFSPNADGAQDTFHLTAELSETADWRLTFSDDGDVIDEETGSGSEVDAAWDGLDGASPVPDGSYEWTLEAWDRWGNAPLVETGTATVDTAAPSLGTVSLPAAVPAAAFSPNGDGVADSLAFTAAMSEPGDVLAHVENASHASIADLTGDARGHAASLSWDGRNGSGTVVADGLYDVSLRARDLAGNESAETTRTVTLYGALASVATTSSVFFPHDRDQFAPSTRLSFRLNRPATVTWDIRRPDGTVVYTRWSGVALGAGTYAIVWTGRDRAGTLLPAGTYLSRVTATNGTLAIAQSVKVQMNAFAIRVSDATPSRRQRITVYATSAEPLRTAPRLRIEEPGLAAWSAVMTRTTGREYKVTITLRSNRTGTLRLRVGGYDTDGRYQATFLSLPLG